MIPTKTKVQLRGTAHQDAELFAQPEQLRIAPPRPITCVVCGEKGVTPACSDEHGTPHPVCSTCTNDPQSAGARLRNLRQALLTQQHDQARRAQTAWDALSDAEKDRWGAWYLMRENTQRSADDQRRYEATKAAYALPYHAEAAEALAQGVTPAEVAEHFGRDALLGARVPPALRAYSHEEECLYWANAALADEGPRLDIRLAQLGVCLEDMGRQSDADALYTPSAS